MKFLLCRLLLLLIHFFMMGQLLCARNAIFVPQIKTLQTVVGDDWLSPPVMTLGSDDVLNISFDELSHEYHRYICHIEHCDPDWEVTQGLFESDYLEGFNDSPIDDYCNSVNTTVPYTHYKLTIPNEQCRLKMSGNYRVTIYDDTEERIPVLKVEFMVVEPKMKVGLEMTTNTDIDVNDAHQQLSMTVAFGGLSVVDVPNQIRTLVTQNGRLDNARKDVRPNIVMADGVAWKHCRPYIFPAGNEYHKYEILSLSHPTMGIDEINWNGNTYDVWPFEDVPRRNYLYDESAKGAFYIRNSDNIENETTCDYVNVHYRLKTPSVPDVQLVVDGWWTVEADTSQYAMDYDWKTGTYTTTILQKQGYYSYNYLLRHPDGRTSIPPSEGSYYQTANRYQAYVYYKERGGRAWHLVGYRQLIMDGSTL